jgi:DNA polymerase-4/protein ImuB
VEHLFYYNTFVLIWEPSLKILCVLLPHFPLRCEVLRQPELDGRPVAITLSEGSQKLVLDYSPELKGRQRDMPIQQAISMYGEIELIHADVRHYWAVFNEILDALELKSPLVEGAKLGDVYIGIDGLQSIYENNDILVSAMRESVPAIFNARMGIAEGKFPAYLAAVYSPQAGYKVLSSDIGAFLKDLPCDLLPVSIKNKAKLHDFGLHTLSHLALMSPAKLQAQFGPEGQVIWELANGRDDTPLYPRLSEENIEESITLVSVTVSLDLILMTLEAMLSKAFVRLGQKGMGISSITIWTRSWMSEHWEQNVRFKEPAMNSRTAMSRIKQFIENVPQPGPVEQLGMKITGTGRPNGKQKSLMSQVRAQEHLLEEIKQLEFRLGGPLLFQFKDVEPWSRIPERRCILSPLNQ